MALVFAIGLLALLLMIGLAFIVNAVNYRKVAENNSARSQSRMFALSAVSRTAFSLLAHSHQYAQYNEGSPPDNFDAVYSFAKYNNDGKVAESGAIEYKDALSGDFSVMMLPASSSVVSTQGALRFNQQFKADEWQGNWVLFTNGKSGADRRIIGRAAWQVISSPAQLLAPVFMRGHLEGLDAEDEEFVPSENRWGREIDEVFIADQSDADDSTRVNYTTLTKVTTLAKNGDKFPSINDYETIYGLTNADSAENHRWVEKWFIPDFNEDKTVANPSFLKWETYGDGLLRFNISELHQKKINEKTWQENYDVNDSADQWYARFNIDSTGEDVNNEKSIELLTQDSLYTFCMDNPNYDFQYFNDFGSNGLPYLRRIGRDKGTFDDLADLRKQIAANFNDYCDGDGVPTSDVDAAEWMNDMDDSANPFTAPKYTGNEKTPYLYELGMFFKVTGNGSEGALTLIKDADADTFSGNTMVFNFAPIIKLANMYPFDATVDGGYKNIRGDITPGAVDVTFSANKIVLKNVKFKYTVQVADANGVTQDESKESECDLTVDLSKYHTGFDNLFGVNARVASGKLKAGKGADGTTDEEVYVDFSGNVENKDGENPYPYGYSEKWLKTLANGDVVLKKADADITVAPVVEILELPEGVTATTMPSDYVNKVADSVEIISYGNIEIQDITVTRVDINLRRAVLSAELTGKLLTPHNKSVDTRVGIDYAKLDFDTAFTWDVSGGQTFGFGSADTEKLIAIGGIKNYDPRQNLNKDDWYLGDLKKGKGEGNTTDDQTKIDSLISAVMDKNSVNTDSNGVEQGFNPENSSSDVKDDETVEEPAYKTETVGGKTNKKYISTAVVRNAPMMSPWEIGFIHRGVRWQTINLKDAPSNFDLDAIDDYNTDDGSRNGSVNWSASGVNYEDGDAAILAEIKMTDQTKTYGKINVNMLRKNHQNYDEKDKDIVAALFNNIRYNEDRWAFINNSTRNSDGKFPDYPGEETGSVIDDSAKLNNILDNFVAERSEFGNRIQFLRYENGSYWLGNAFTSLGAGSLENDASQEEIVGKTINLLSAETGTPSVVNVLVVAQSIRDVGGIQVKPTDETDKSRFTNPYGSTIEDIEDGMITMECESGRFDLYTHLDDSDKDVGKSVYFDEITGEVKIFVRLYHDSSTGKLIINKIDYL